MMLIEQTSVPTAALPVDAFKDHLQLGRGFTDDGAQDALLEQMLRAALAAIEARTGKVTVSRDYKWSLTAWRMTDEQAMPVAPVEAITQLSIVDREGVEAVIDPATYRLVKDDHRPRLMPQGSCLPSIPSGGMADVYFQAGMGPGWADIPADLSHAVVLLSAHYYEHRHDLAAVGGAMPHGVNSLIQRYRTVRVLGGRGRT